MPSEENTGASAEPSRQAIIVPAPKSSKQVVSSERETPSLNLGPIITPMQSHQRATLKDKKNYRKSTVYLKSVMLDLPNGQSGKKDHLNDDKNYVIEGSKYNNPKNIETTRITQDLKYEENSKIKDHMVKENLINLVDICNTLKPSPMHIRKESMDQNDNK